MFAIARRAELRQSFSQLCKVASTAAPPPVQLKPKVHKFFLKVICCFKDQSFLWHKCLTTLIEYSTGRGVVIKWKGSLNISAQAIKIEARRGKKNIQVHDEIFEFDIFLNFFPECFSFSFLHICTQIHLLCSLCGIKALTQSSTEEINQHCTHSKA